MYFILKLWVHVSNIGRGRWERLCICLEVFWADCIFFSLPPTFLHFSPSFVHSFLFSFLPSFLNSFSFPSFPPFFLPPFFPPSLPYFLSEIEQKMAEVDEDPYSSREEMVINWLITFTGITSNYLMYRVQFKWGFNEVETFGRGREVTLNCAHYIINTS